MDMIEDKLILLVRKYPTCYEIHRHEILQEKNLILTTSDKEFATKIVDSYNASTKLIFGSMNKL